MKSQHSSGGTQLADLLRHFLILFGSSCKYLDNFLALFFGYFSCLIVIDGFSYRFKARIHFFTDFFSICHDLIYFLYIISLIWLYHEVPTFFFLIVVQLLKKFKNISYFLATTSPLLKLKTIKNH